MMKIFEPVMATACYSVNRGHVLWFTGLPGAGKTTLSHALKRYLDNLQVPSVVLDGDDLRAVFPGIVGNDLSARMERSLAYARLTSVLVRNRVLVLLAAINGTRGQRDEPRSLHDTSAFSLAWVKTPRDICIARDPKGLYRNGVAQMNRGYAAQVVGMDLAFEDPEDAEITFDTINESVEESCRKALSYLLKINVLQNSESRRQP